MSILRNHQVTEKSGKSPEAPIQVSFDSIHEKTQKRKKLRETLPTYNKNPKNRPCSDKRYEIEELFMRGHKCQHNYNHIWLRQIYLHNQSFLSSYFNNWF